MVKGQSQIAGFWNKFVCSISLDFFAGKLPNLVLWMPYDSNWCSIHMVKGHGQTAGLWTNVVRSVSYESFACLPNIRQWMPLKRDVPNWFSGHFVKGQSQTADLPLNI